MVNDSPAIRAQDSFDVASVEVSRANTVHSSIASCPVGRFFCPVHLFFHRVIVYCYRVVQGVKHGCLVVSSAVIPNRYTVIPDAVRVNAIYGGTAVVTVTTACYKEEVVLCFCCKPLRMKQSFRLDVAEGMAKGGRQDKNDEAERDETCNNNNNTTKQEHKTEANKITETN